MEPLRFRGYPQEPKLCVIRHLAAYLHLTKPLRQCTSLFIGLIKPHSAVSKDTLSRWCKDTLNNAGVDIHKYSSHSSRAAASSKAKSKGMSLKHISRSAGLTHESTFAKWYDKDIEDIHLVEDYLL